MRGITGALVLGVMVNIGCDVDPTGVPAEAFHLQPACVAPAPLVGTFDPRAPGYLVQFRDGVDVQATVEVLADRYNFEAVDIWEHAIRGFFAILPNETVRALRCESAVRLIEHNAVVSITGF